MPITRRSAFLTIATLAITLAVGTQVAIGKKQESSSAQMDARKRAAHALNRLTFGPRPGDVDHEVALSRAGAKHLRAKPRDIEAGGR